MLDRKKRIYAKRVHCAGLLLIVLPLLYGCTRKEELLLLNGESVIADGETIRAEEGAALSAGNDPDADADGNGVQADISGEYETVAQVRMTEENAAPSETGHDTICIHVCGAVRLPGVYELTEGSRVYEAVQAAGGFAEGADQNYVNQAQKLSDGVKLVIPTMEEAEKAREGEAGAGKERESAVAQIGVVGETSFTEPESSGQAQEGAERININKASEAQLCDIPGIGATRAAAIIAYRESHGGFQKLEDIMKVNGIKEGMYEKIKDSISVN